MNHTVNRKASKAKRGPAPAPQIVPWERFLREVRLHLKADELPVLDRAVAKLHPAQRERIAGLTVEQAVAAFRAELGLTTR